MADLNARDVEAIRFAVLRRLAPGMRHALMGELQSIQFSAELATRLLETDDGARLEACVRQIGPVTRSAVARCAAMIEWLRTDDGATVSCSEALSECVQMNRDEWSLRGIEATADARTGDERVQKTALRELVVASLLVLIDALPGPLDLSVVAEAAGSEVVVRLRAQRSGRAAPLPLHAPARKLDGADLAALAAAHGVACAYMADGVTLRLPVRSGTAAPEEHAGHGDAIR